MKKEQIQILVIGVGVAVLAYFLSQNLKPAAKRAAVSEAPPAASADAVLPAVPASARGRDKTAALQLKRWEAAWGRDPFWSASDSMGKLSEFELKGISFAADKKGYAYINDQIVRAGDTMGGYTVSRIEKDRVCLTRGAQTFFLTFSDN